MTRPNPASEWVPGEASGRRERLVTAAGIAVLAACSAYRGLLPGQAIAGATLTGVVWALLFVGLGAAYRSMAREPQVPSRRIDRAVGASLLAALLATQACRLVVARIIGPHAWSHFFYLRWLAPALLIPLACLLFLPRDTVGLYRRARADRVASMWLAFVLFLVVAAVLVSVSDLGFEWRALDIRLRRDLVAPNAWVTNIALLFAAYVLAFALTARVAAALIVITPVYLVLVVATLAKIRFMHAAVQPLDLLRLPEFAPLFDRFFGTAATVTLVMTMVLWVCALASALGLYPWRLSAARRLALGLGALAALVAVPAAFYFAPTQPALGELVTAAGAPEDWHREKARANGVLLSFLSEVRSALVPPPAVYSARAVRAALARHHVAETAAVSPRTPRHHVNLIVYLVESFMDPDDLGLRFTRDPIPNVRAAAGGRIESHAIVPERFGGSANTEFEVLSGMALAYLPEGSLPFRQYIRRPIPSLPRLLGELGYATTAIQADAKYYYNREQAYDLLGFDNVVWLNDSAGVERAARPGWPADRAVVNAVIDATRRQRPFFVFAFPSSTHSPYNSGVYRNSTLDLAEAVSGDTAQEIKEYINTLEVADQAIGTLIEHFRHEPDSTVIAIMGDHLAPLSGGALSRFFQGLAGLSDAEQARRTRRVPLVVWANFRLPAEVGELSVNGLPELLLEEMNVQPTGLLAVSDEVRRSLPVLSTYVQSADGRVWAWDSLPPKARALVEDHRLLQYDALLGKHYAVEPGAGGAKVVDHSTRTRSSP
jgi:phosphoglycerol transferase MdoB-like AlkP superfamily enzyme